MSKWHLRKLGEASEPISFEELAAQVRLGNVSPDDQVRRENTPQWQRADQVVGLFRAARRPAGSETLPAPTSQPIPSEPAHRESGSSRVPPGARRRSASAFGWCFALAIAGAMVAWIDHQFRTEALRFPPPRAMQPAVPPWRFWGWQGLSFAEFALLWFDSVVLLALAILHGAGLILKSARRGKAS